MNFYILRPILFPCKRKICKANDDYVWKFVLLAAVLWVKVFNFFIQKCDIRTTVSSVATEISFY